MTSIDLPPYKGASMSVRAYNLCPPPIRTTVPPRAFLKPLPPGREFYHPPVFAFLLEHSNSGKKIMFDLGPRKDLENAAPSIAKMLQPPSPNRLPVDKDIIEILNDSGYKLEDIDQVIWSHSHIDHVGDMSKFPNRTELVVGKGTDTKGYPTNEDANLLDSDFANRKLLFVNFSASSLVIGDYQAVDYFQDGSLFLLSVPGHMEGHLCALVRTSEETFILLGADSGHHIGQIRPTEQLHRNFSCPGHIVTEAMKTVSWECFGSEKDGKFDLTTHMYPLFDVKDTEEGGYDANPEETRRSLEKLTVFDAHRNVFVILAHDESLVALISSGGKNGKLPGQGLELGDWKSKGWKEEYLWKFVEQQHGGYIFSPER